MTSPPAPREDAWVAIAAVARAHGLKGAVVLKPFTRDPHELLEVELPTVHFRRQGRVQGEARLTYLAAFKDLLLAEIEGVDGRTAAEQLAGTELVIAEKDLWELPEGSYLADDLVGIEAHDAATGSAIGRIVGVQEGTASDYLLLEIPGRAGRPVMVPFIGQFVGDIDMERRRVPLTLPPGFLEI